MNCKTYILLLFCLILAICVKYAKSNTTNDCPYHPYPQDLTEDEFTNSIAPVLSEISNYMNSNIDELIRPGISANIVYKDRIIWEGNYGQVSQTNRTRPTGDTIFRIASISKILPTIFLYKLVENGQVNLDDPITKYAPNFEIPNPFKFNGELTLIDLASQINGIPTFFPYDIIERDYFTWNGTLEETLTRLRNQILVIEPRTTCYYSNMAYALLAHILARNFTADGIFENWAQPNIVDKLGLRNTGFVITDEIAKKMAVGYYSTGQEAPLVETNFLRPAGNYYSSARDLAVLSMSLMGTISRRVLSQESLDKMLRIVQRCGYGYFSEFTGSPWEINEMHTYLVRQKYGDIDGYSATLAMIPELQLSFTFLINGPRPTQPLISTTVLNMIIPAFVDVLRKKNQNVLPAEQPSRYVGFYQIDGIQYWNVTSTDDNIIQMTNPKDPGTPYRTVGLSYVAEGILKLTLLGGEYPCVIGQSNLEVQNGALLQFTNMSEGIYNEFSIPALNTYGFKRLV